MAYTDDDQYDVTTPVLAPAPVAGSSPYAALARDPAIVEPPLRAPVSLPTDQALAPPVVPQSRLPAPEQAVEPVATGPGYDMPAPRFRGASGTIAIGGDELPEKEARLPVQTGALKEIEKSDPKLAAALTEIGQDLHVSPYDLAHLIQIQSGVNPFHQEGDKEGYFALSPEQWDLVDPKGKIKDRKNPLANLYAGATLWQHANREFPPGSLNAVAAFLTSPETVTDMLARPDAQQLIAQKAGLDWNKLDRFAGRDVPDRLEPGAGEPSTPQVATAPLPPQAVAKLPSVASQTGVAPLPPLATAPLPPVETTPPAPQVATAPLPQIATAQLPTVESQTGISVLPQQATASLPSIETTPPRAQTATAPLPEPPPRPQVATALLPLPASAGVPPPGVMDIDARPARPVIGASGEPITPLPSGMDTSSGLGAGTVIGDALRYLTQRGPAPPGPAQTYQPPTPPTEPIPPTPPTPANPNAPPVPVATAPVPTPAPAPAAAAPPAALPVPSTGAGAPPAAPAPAPAAPPTSPPAAVAVSAPTKGAPTVGTPTAGGTAVTPAAPQPVRSLTGGTSSVSLPEVIKAASDGNPEVTLQYVANNIPQGMGMSAGWDHLYHKIAQHGLRFDEPEKAAAMQELVFRTQHQGTVLNLQAAYNALKQGDTPAAIKYLAKSHAFFNDGAIGQFGAYADGRVFGQRFDEATHKKIGAPFEIRPQDVLAQINMTRNPQTFLETLNRERKTNADILHQENTERLTERGQAITLRGQDVTQQDAQYRAQAEALRAQATQDEHNRRHAEDLGVRLHTTAQAEADRIDRANKTAQDRYGARVTHTQALDKSMETLFDPANKVTDLDGEWPTEKYSQASQLYKALMLEHPEMSNSTAASLAKGYYQRLAADKDKNLPEGFAFTLDPTKDRDGRLGFAFKGRDGKQVPGSYVPASGLVGSSIPLVPEMMAAQPSQGMRQPRDLPTRPVPPAPAIGYQPSPAIPVPVMPPLPAPPPFQRATQPRF